MRTPRMYVAVVVLALFAVGCEGEPIPIGPSPIASTFDVDITLTVITDPDSGKTDGDSGSGNVGPLLSGLADQEHTAGQSVSVIVECVDPNPGDRLTLTATGLPRGLSMGSAVGVGAVTGIIQGEISSSSPNSSPFSSAATCSDGSLSDAEAFAWIVNAPS